MTARAVQQREMIPHFTHFIWGFDFAGSFLISKQGMGNGRRREGDEEGPQRGRDRTLSPPLRSLLISFSLSLCLSVSSSLLLSFFHSPLPIPHPRCLSGRNYDRSRRRR